MDLLDPKVDFVFKRIFGSEENKDVLLRFLNDALTESVTSISLVNPYIDKDALEDKQSVLDIKAVTAKGEQINIEIQLSNKQDMENERCIIGRNCMKNRCRKEKNTGILKRP